MQWIQRLFRAWLPLAVVTVCMSGLIYLAVQQNLRSEANDPQIQISEDVAFNLASGSSVEKETTAYSTVDVERSLAPFLIVYSQDGRVIASTVTLHGQTPSLPEGMLASSSKTSQNRVTWQPAHGVRIAAVITPVKGGSGGYVLAGRSLREVEERENSVELEAGLAMLVTLAASLVMTLLVQMLLHRGPRPD